MSCRGSKISPFVVVRPANSSPYELATPRRTSEERDLVHEFGDSYIEYRRNVPMLIPFWKRQAKMKIRTTRTA